MKFSSAMFTFSVFVVAVSASTISKTTASSMRVILDDFNQLAHLYQDTVTALNGFPQSGEKGATRIHNNEVTIENIFDDVNTQLQILPKPVSEKNAEKIINTYQDFTPTIIKSLNQIEAKAADFGNMKAATLMSADVLMAANRCAIFTQNIVAMTPPSMTDEVNNMFTELTAARQAASAALATVING